ncbi:MAG TPA: acetyl-CoA carboxylase carboxyltransferase subunit alpha [bacterium]|nr:acetyl-CoA carboxylase carboxyltransferase subunit alpha [bacterium]HQL61856.1 acetyl-CoA carboxylase carboxyltransferase subunit alpha [bacterium]
MRYLDFEQPLREIETKIEELEMYARSREIDLSEEIGSLKRRAEELLKEIFQNLTPWQRIQLARHPDRPYFLDYMKMIATDFIELHGDRNFADDQAIVTGLCAIDGRSVAVIGHQKGRDTEENLRRNFGMAHPEGFRKAMRIMELAGREGIPVITFIDSAGAYPGIGAEERGQHEAIARNLLVMSELPAPIICVVTGEGGSGGALAIGIGNRVLILEYAYYAVCTPEACAAIIYKDRTLAKDVAGNMRIIAPDLLRLGLVEEIIPEPFGAAHRNPKEAAQNVKHAILRHLDDLSLLSPQELIEQRYRRFRGMGQFVENPVEGN